MTTLSLLLQQKIIAIIRGAAPEAVLPIVEALQQGGICAVEVTLNSTNALQLIKELSKSFEDKMLVGAGTVLDAASAAEAINAGAQFIIAPSVDVETIRFTKESDVVSIPGAFTATEIVTAYKAGADLIKVFPATSPQYIKELKGPLDHIPLMPTGGINLQNIKEFQKAGAVAFGIGSALVDARQEVSNDTLMQLTERARLFVQAIQHA